jgi:hypothetical protein
MFISFAEPAPPLILRLLDTTGKAEKETIELPRQFAESLILHRNAQPVADFRIVPDIVVSEDDVEGVTIGPELWREPLAA